MHTLSFSKNGIEMKMSSTRDPYSTAIHIDTSANLSFTEFASDNKGMKAQDPLLECSECRYSDETFVLGLKKGFRYHPGDTWSRICRYRNPAKGLTKHRLQIIHL